MSEHSSILLPSYSLGRDTWKQHPLPVSASFRNQMRSLRQSLFISFAKDTLPTEFNSTLFNLLGDNNGRNHCVQTCGDKDYIIHQGLFILAISFTPKSHAGSSQDQKSSLSSTSHNTSLSPLLIMFDKTGEQQSLVCFSVFLQLSTLKSTKKFTMEIL